MIIQATDEEKNTLRAALRSHQDKVWSAQERARKAKDEEHGAVLRRELDNVKAALAAL